MYLGDHCKVAMAECIPDNEENKFVYHMSEEVHRVLTEQQQKYPNFSVVHKKIDSVKSRMGKIRGVSIGAMCRQTAGKLCIFRHCYRYTI